MSNLDGWQTIDTLVRMHHELADSGNTRSSTSKALEEAFFVNIATSHMGLTDNQSLVWPLDNEIYRAPDALVSLTPLPPTHTDVLPVEVVQYTSYSRNEDLLNFLKRTKLSPVYQYQVGTMIVCAILEDIGDPEELALALALSLSEQKEALRAYQYEYELVLLFMYALEREECSKVVIQVFPKLKFFENPIAVLA